MSGTGKRRGALSDQGGEVRTDGDPRIAGILARALEATGIERGAGGAFDPDGLTHGFHSFPARMHRGVAAGVVEALSRPRDVVLDPFCGSGTVVVEAMVAGRRAVGVDFNPLALRVAEVKLDLRGPRSRSAFADLLREVAARSEERVRGRVPVQAQLHRSEVQWYSGHTLKEMAGLFEEIRSVEGERDRRALEMVFSANVVKLSRQQADTAERVAEKRLRKGLPTEFFLRKGLELVSRWEALADATPRKAPPSRLLLGDARRLERILARRPRPDLILSSPPYGGTYDYVDHHARRYPWLGIDPRRFARGELGARRNLSGPDAEARWEEEVRDFLGAIASVRRSGMPVVLLVGDAQLGERRVCADVTLRELAPAAGLEVRAVASQSRRDWQGGPRRRESLVMMD